MEYNYQTNTLTRVVHSHSPWCLMNTPQHQLSTSLIRKSVLWCLCIHTRLSISGGEDKKGRIEDLINSFASPWLCSLCIHSTLGIKIKMPGKRKSLMQWTICWATIQKQRAVIFCTSFVLYFFRRHWQSRIIEVLSLFGTHSASTNHYYIYCARLSSPHRNSQYSGTLFNIVWFRQ